MARNSPASSRDKKCRQKALSAAAKKNNRGPTDAETNLLSTLFGAGRYTEMENFARQLVANYPCSVRAWKILAAVLQALGKDTLPALQKAVELAPDDAETHKNLAGKLNELGQFNEAVYSCRRALAIRPDYAAAHGIMGAALTSLGHLDDALTNLRLSQQLNPDCAETYNDLGNTLQGLGLIDEAVENYRHALALKPDFHLAYSNILFTLNYHPDLSAEEIYRAYQEYDARYGIPLRTTWHPHNNDRSPNRRLRIGYVSPDFRKHSMDSFLQPLLSHHDKTQTEVYAYAELNQQDELTARYKNQVEHWIPTKGMSDEVLAERIRSDGIDILVDLAGHTTGNRLGVFARKPAPVSFSMMGFGYTTGLTAIDYFLIDAAALPAGSEHLFSEQPWRIPSPAFPYRPAAGMGEVNRLPALERGHITFGTLSRSVRINHRTIRVWAALLNAVPHSKLVIDSLNFQTVQMQDRLAGKFAEYGIERERLDIGFHTPPWDVLRGIDISLDCFPHNSGTTLFESLYMGVPFITMAGRPSVGRLGCAILHGTGHPEWIANTETEYVEKAAELTNDLARLARYRSTLRSELENSEVFIEAGFVQKMETAYRQMWQRWCESHAVKG